jgi:hypothetical protein
MKETTGALVLNFSLPAGPPKALLEPLAAHNRLADRYAALRGEIRDAKIRAQGRPRKGRDRIRRTLKVDAAADPKSENDHRLEGGCPSRGRRSRRAPHHQRP